MPAFEDQGLRSSVTGPEILAYLAAAALVALALFLYSGLAPWMSPDTGGYLEATTRPDIWGGPRHPLFGWVVRLVGGPGYGWLPAIQVGLFVAAAAFLLAALRDYGLSVRATAAVAVSLLLSNLILLWHHAVHPEFLSAASMLAALALVVRLASGGRFAPHAVLLGAALGFAYLLRPTFLPAILLLPLLFGLLTRLRSPQPVGRRMAWLVLACGLPFAANSALRLQAVGDFNIVSFGGFQMSGMAGLMLTPEIVARLPDDVRPLAQTILDGREAAEGRGEVLQTPPNSRGERSFVSAALGYYDLYARTYDSLLYGTIAPLQGQESWVGWNRRLMRLSLATIRAAPDRYAAWVVGATSRAVGRMVVTNGPLMLALAALALLYPAALWFGRLPREPAGSHLDVPALLCLTGIYTVSASALMVVTTFPAARYLDTAGLLLPALPILGLIRLAQGWRDR